MVYYKLLKGLYSMELREDAAVPLNYFKILSRHLFGGAEENYEIKI
jgi:hypothetical protein